MRKALVAMMLYLVIFGLLAAISIYGYVHHTALVDVGFPTQVTNLFVLVLSVAGLVKSLWHIHRIKL